MHGLKALTVFYGKLLQAKEEDEGKAKIVV